MAVTPVGTKVAHSGPRWGGLGPVLATPISCRPGGSMGQILGRGEGGRGRSGGTFGGYSPTCRRLILGKTLANHGLATGASGGLEILLGWVGRGYDLAVRHSGARNGVATGQQCSGCGR